MDHYRVRDLLPDPVRLANNPDRRVHVVDPEVDDMAFTETIGLLDHEHWPVRVADQWLS